MSDPMLDFYKLKLEPHEYEHLEFMCALSKDEDGELVLAGLNLDESIWYIESGRAWLMERLSGKRRASEDREKYLEMAERHQLARIQQVMDRAASGRP